MRPELLNHLIAVVRAVAQPTRVLVLGSASLLPAQPELGNRGAPLELTPDADFLLEPVNEAIAESLQVAAGRDSASRRAAAFIRGGIPPQGCGIRAESQRPHSRHPIGKNRRRLRKRGVAAASRSR